MMLRTRGAVALALLLVSTAATGAEKIRSPTGKWTVDFADAQCVASREYGTSDRPLSLALKQPAIGGLIQLAIVEPGNAVPVQDNITVQFDVGRPIKTTMLTFSPPKTKRKVHLINLAAAEFSAAGSATSVNVHGSGFFEQRWALSHMQDVLLIMNDCVADLRRAWNVSDSSGSTRPSRRASGSLVGLFSHDDYPNAAVFSGQTGTVGVILLVDEKGAVADCTVTETSGVALLDAQTCAIIKLRSHFTPAVGKDGKPAKDAFGQRVSWQMP